MTYPSHIDKPTREPPRHVTSSDCSRCVEHMVEQQQHADTDHTDEPGPSAQPKDDTSAMYT
jgi:hypothetical protein